MIKKALLSIGVAVGFALSAKAATITLNVAATGYTNALSGSATITQFILTSISTNAANVSFVDSYTNSLWFTNGAYTTATSYATNYYNCYTNYFGGTNCITNVALVDIITTNAAAGVRFPVRINATAPTNSSVAFQGVNYYFNNGVWLTNSSSSVATVTITYQQ